MPWLDPTGNEQGFGNESELSYLESRINAGDIPDSMSSWQYKKDDVLTIGNPGEAAERIIVKKGTLVIFRLYLRTTIKITLFDITHHNGKFEQRKLISPYKEE